MGKKTKSKQRLDQYYRFAKTQGYRSRAAYKLIQLNRKYGFLTQATTVIDLCSAPGGWLQVCANTMPPNSIIIGVDLVQIKKIPGTITLKGDITKSETFTALKRELKNKKCDVVLNDGAPNVGANWNKDAYTQSQLVLAAFKLATQFLRQKGTFITKVFRSTDTNSLMWVFRKFFQRVEMTKPKASRFTSAQTFVAGIGFTAPNFIDQKYFDPQHVFRDTEADHFQQQIAGEITSIDKLLQNKRKRGGYDDNAPMHLYKQTSLTDFINASKPLLIFAQFNKITVNHQQSQKYYKYTHKIPNDIDQLFNDLKTLGKREISSLLKWRGKIRQILYKEKIRDCKIGNKNKLEKNQYQSEHGEHQENNNEQQQENQDKESAEQAQNSSDELEKQLLSERRKQLKQVKGKQEKRKQLLLKAEQANQNLNNDNQFDEQRFEDILGSDGDIENLDYSYQEQEQPEIKNKKPRYADYNAKEMEDNLEQLYQTKKQRKQAKIQHVRQVQRQKKDRREQRIITNQNKLKSRRFGPDDRNQQQQQQQQQQQNNHQQKSNKWNHSTTDQKFQGLKFKNPLAAFDDDEGLCYSDQGEVGQQQKIDPNEKMQGELSDDDAYIIPKPLSDMEKRRKKIRKNEQKKLLKQRKGIDGDVQSGGHIQIVKHKTMENYDIDTLAETLVIGKKMLRNHSRQEIIDSSYQRFNFQDHDQLPKWFTQDEKKHNFKKLPITKRQFKEEKERLMAINARVPKKILEAKVRRKIRTQKKLKKAQKKADSIMKQQGITQASKMRQIGKLYDQSKRKLKQEKRYVIGRKNGAVGGKDSRNIKHVDRRLKKDKRATKRISKKRQIKRHHQKRGRF